MDTPYIDPQLIQARDAEQRIGLGHPLTWLHVDSDRRPRTVGGQGEFVVYSTRVGDAGDFSFTQAGQPQRGFGLREFSAAIVGRAVGLQYATFGNDALTEQRAFPGCRFYCQSCAIGGLHDGELQPP